MLKRAMIWGAAAAAGGALWALIEYALGFHTDKPEVGRYTGFIAIIFPIVAIVEALRPDRAEKGGLSFGQGLAQGSAVTLVLAVLGVLFFLIYFSSINPDFLKKAGPQPVSMGEQLSLLFISSLIGGIVISLVAAFLLRRTDESARR